jgi:hypothetical protein
MASSVQRPFARALGRVVQSTKPGLEGQRNSRAINASASFDGPLGKAATILSSFASALS